MHLDRLAVDLHCGAGLGTAVDDDQTAESLHFFDLERRRRRVFRTLRLLAGGHDTKGPGAAPGTAGTLRIDRGDLPIEQAFAAEPDPRGSFASVVVVDQIGSKERAARDVEGVARRTSDRPPGELDLAALQRHPLLVFGSHRLRLPGQRFGRGQQIADLLNLLLGAQLPGLAVGRGDLGRAPKSADASGALVGIEDDLSLRVPSNLGLRFRRRDFAGAAGVVDVDPAELDVRHPLFIAGDDVAALVELHHRAGPHHVGGAVGKVDLGGAVGRSPDPIAVAQDIVVARPSPSTVLTAPVLHAALHVGEAQVAALVRFRGHDLAQHPQAALGAVERRAIVFLGEIRVRSLEILPGTVMLDSNLFEVDSSFQPPGEIRRLGDGRGGAILERLMLPALQQKAAGDQCRRHDQQANDPADRSHRDAVPLHRRPLVFHCRHGREYTTPPRRTCPLFGRLYRVDGLVGDDRRGFEEKGRTMALRYMRENLKHLKWVLWGVVFIMFAFVFFEWGGYDPSQSRGGDVAATVGAETITYGEFQRQYQLLESNLRQAFGEQFNRDMVQQFNLPQRALDQLIDRRILLMEARDVGLAVTDEEVRKAILEYPTFKDENGLFVGAETYQRILRANRITVDDFESSMRDEVLIGKLDSILEATAYVSDQAVERAFRDQNERAKIRWVELPASQFEDIEVSEEEVATYFADNQADYELPERRVVDYLLVDTIQMRREIEIPEEELRAYYDDHPDEFTREEQVRASHILFKVTPDRPDDQAREDLLAVRQRIEGGENFAELAQALSEDEGSAASGGSLGYFGRGAMIPAFEEAAFNAQVGDLVGPVKTDFGYHLIEVQDHRQGGMQPFEQVQAIARSRLVGERVEELATQKAEDVEARLKSLVDEGSAADDPMTVIAEEEGLEMQTTEPFGRGETVAGLGRDPALMARIFELEAGEIADATQVPRGWVIARVAEIEPPRTPELTEVEEEVRTAVEQEKRGTAALARLQEAEASLADDATLEDLAAGLELEIQDSEEFGRFGSIPGLSSSRQVVGAALELEEGQRSEPIETTSGAVLFEVVERKVFDPSQFEEEKETTRQGEEAQRVQQMRASLIELRRRDLAPTYDPQVLENFGIGQTGS